MKTKKISIGGRIEVNPKEVIAMIADGNYSHVHMNDGQRFLVATTLKKLEVRFQARNMFRLHRNSVINLRYLENYDRQNFQFVKLKNGIILSISRRKKEGFLRKIQ